MGRPWQFDRRVTHDGYKNRYSFGFNGKNVILAPLSPKEVYQDQLKLVKHSDGGSGSEEKKIEGKEAKREKNQLHGPLVSDCTNQKKNEGCAGEKKERERENKSVKKLNFFAKERELKSAYMGRRSLIAIRFKENLLVSTDLDPSLPSVFVSLLQEFDDVFPEETPSGLPPLDRKSVV